MRLFVTLSQTVAESPDASVDLVLEHCSPAVLVALEHVDGPNRALPLRHALKVRQRVKAHLRGGVDLDRLALAVSRHAATLIPESGRQSARRGLRGTLRSQLRAATQGRRFMLAW